MKANNSKRRATRNSAEEARSRLAAVEKLVKAARDHFRMIKVEYKHARKAFKQAKKAAKAARAEAGKSEEASQRTAMARKRPPVRSRTKRRTAAGVRRKKAVQFALPPVPPAEPSHSSDSDLLIPSAPVL
jgi:hypothetical protein